MITPFIPEELFQVNENLKVELIDDHIIIDNYYKNFEEIHTHLNNMPVPRWKWSENGGNFKDYYDCRPKINTNFYSDIYVKDMTNLLSIIKNAFMEERNIFPMNADAYEFNYLKHINVPDNNLQFYPHKDFPYAGICYLDKICSGGTAIYSEIDDLVNAESEYLFYDVADVDKKLIPAKPNRLVLFKADQMHGGYIEDHSKYKEDWRITQVLFFNYEQ